MWQVTRGKFPGLFAQSVVLRGGIAIYKMIFSRMVVDFPGKLVLPLCQYPEVDLALGLGERGEFVGADKHRLVSGVAWLVVNLGPSS